MSVCLSVCRSVCLFVGLYVCVLVSLHCYLKKRSRVLFSNTENSNVSKRNPKGKTRLNIYCDIWNNKTIRDYNLNGSTLPILIAKNLTRTVIKAVSLILMYSHTKITQLLNDCSRKNVRNWSIVPQDVFFFSRILTNVFSYY